MSDRTKYDDHQATAAAEEVSHPRSLLLAREFALIAAFREKYGETALSLARQTNLESGKRAGREALAKHPIDTLDAAGAARLYALWSCATPAVEVGERHVTFRNAGPCANWRLWRQSGLTLAEGCECHGAWAEGFFQAINPAFRRTRAQWRPGGDRVCEETYELVDE